eukprot:g42624.t1
MSSAVGTITARRGKGNLILRGIVAVPSDIVHAILFSSFGDVYYWLPIALPWRLESNVGKGKRRDCIVLDWASQVNICLTSNWKTLLVRCKVFNCSH